MQKKTVVDLKLLSNIVGNTAVVDAAIRVGRNTVVCSLESDVRLVFITGHTKNRNLRECWRWSIPVLGEIPSSQWYGSTPMVLAWTAMGVIEQNPTSGRSSGRSLLERAHFLAFHA